MNTLTRETNGYFSEYGGDEFRFLWLELTSRCNLRCVHCYAESAPKPERADVLASEDYFHLIDEAAELGCRKLQFIGGEPTIVRELPELIVHARRSGFEFVEVFTNATRVTDQLLDCFVENDVAIATSFYCDQSDVHDTITKRVGSHRRTVNTLSQLLDAGLAVRAGIIVMDHNRDRVVETTGYLHELGVENVGVDRVRSFGRGADLSDGYASGITELCGSCWQGSLCVSPDGQTSPCIMAKNWSVGTLLKSSLSEIVRSRRLLDVRTKIYQEVWLPQQKNMLKNGVESQGSIHGEQADCDPRCYPSCNPYCSPSCSPGCGPNCEPMCSPRCSPACSPCFPHGKCNPELYCGPCMP